jgi:nicotinamide mononucleotide transporter
MISWLSENIIEIFGAVTGIAYVFLEIRRNILLWPLGILTSAVYIYVFGSSGFYSNMGLQVYYLVISIYGWILWHRAQGTGHRAQGTEQGGHKQDEEDHTELMVSDVKRIDRKTLLICLVIAAGLWGFLWFALDRWTDSPVPQWDALITSLSVVATWMLTRKYLEQWYMWILADSVAVIIYAATGLYATAVLFVVYTMMAVIGVRAWGREQGERRKEKGERRKAKGERRKEKGERRKYLTIRTARPHDRKTSDHQTLRRSEATDNPAIRDIKTAKRKDY